MSPEIKRMVLLFNRPSFGVPRSLKSSVIVSCDATRTNTANIWGWDDLSGRGNWMALYNFGGTAESGWNDGALVFDGVNDYVQKTITLNPGNQSLTIMVAFKLPNLVGEKYIALGTQGTTARSFGLYMSDASLVFACMDSTIGSWWTQTVTTLEADKWYHAAITVNQDTLLAHVYINAEQVLEFTDLVAGLREVNRFKCGINTGNSAYGAMSLRGLSAYSCAATPGQVREAYDENKLRWQLT